MSQLNKKTKYYGGQGFDQSKETGNFEVRSSNTQQFNRLSDAKQYYNSLDEAKSLWDISGVPELLESYTYKKSNIVETKKKNMTTAELEEIMSLTNEAISGIEDDGDYCYTVLFGQNGPFIVANDISGDLSDGESAVVVTYSVNRRVVSLIGTEFINY